MIDLEDLMTHSYDMDIEFLDKNTKLLVFRHEIDDYQGEYSITNEELIRLKNNLIKLTKLLK